MGKRLAPVAVWTAGALYYTYFTGEVMRLFDVAEVVFLHWERNLLAVQDQRTREALDRLYRKRSRRITVAERARLYKRVFNLGELDPSLHPAAPMHPAAPLHFTAANESFPADWNRLMKGVTAYREYTHLGAADLAALSRTLIEQATRDIQYSLSTVMSGTAYLTAAEVYTLLRETLDLLKSEEILAHFGVEAGGALGLAARVAEEHFNTKMDPAVIYRLAEAGSRILQDWVARFGEGVNTEARFTELLVHAQEWSLAYEAFQSARADEA